jgi:hypothetical protein
LNVNLGEAKRLVHCSPTWADVRQRDDEFHDQFSTIPGTQEGQ